jgi:shikimate kinase
VEKHNNPLRKIKCQYILFLQQANNRRYHCGNRNFVADAYDYNKNGILKEGYVMENIILIGASHRGKSTLGKLAAEKTGMRFLDTDEMVVGYAVKSGDPASIFRRFIEYQRRAVREAMECREPVIISTGAEIVANRADFALLCGSGYVIHVRRSSERCAGTGLNTVIVRTIIGKDGGKMEEVYDRNAMINDYARDLPVYDKAADVILDNNGTVEEGLEKLLAVINEAKNSVRSRVDVTPAERGQPPAIPTVVESAHNPLQTTVRECILLI